MTNSPLPSANGPGNRAVLVCHRPIRSWLTVVKHTTGVDSALIRLRSIRYCFGRGTCWRAWIIVTSGSSGTSISTTRRFYRRYTPQATPTRLIIGKQSVNHLIGVYWPYGSYRLRNVRWWTECREGHCLRSTEAPEFSLGARAEIRLKSLHWEQHSQSPISPYILGFRASFIVPRWVMNRRHGLRADESETNNRADGWQMDCSGRERRQFGCRTRF